MSGAKRAPVEIRSILPADIPRIMELGRVCFRSTPPDRQWKAEQLEAHLKVFPEGQWVALHGERIVGSCTNLRVELDEALRQHTWTEITGKGMLTTHKPEGDTLYGTEVMVHPDARRQGIAKRLYQRRKDYIVQNGLRAFVSGGRIPGFHEHASEMSVHEYVAKVVAGKLTDRTLTPQLKSGMKVVGILENYLTDPKSHGYATILLWQPPRTPKPKSGTLDEVGYEP